MKLLRVLLVGLATWAFCCAPALAAMTATAITAQGTVGYQANGISVTNSTATNADSPIGSLVVIAPGYYGTTTITAIFDDAGGGAGNCSGAYTSENQQQLNSIKVSFGFCNQTTIDLPSAGHVETTFAASTAKTTLAAFKLSGVATSSPIDTAARTNASGTSVGPASINITPTGASSSRHELLIACIWIAGSNTADSYTEDGTWTAIGSGVLSSGNAGEHCAYQEVSSNGTVAWHPAWSTNSRAYTQLVSGFLAPATTTTPRGTLLGVGP